MTGMEDRKEETLKRPSFCLILWGEVFPERSPLMINYSSVELQLAEQVHPKFQPSLSCR